MNHHRPTTPQDTATALFNAVTALCGIQPTAPDTITETIRICVSVGACVLGVGGASDPRPQERGNAPFTALNAPTDQEPTAPEERTEPTAEPSTTPDTAQPLADLNGTPEDTHPERITPQNGNDRPTICTEGAGVEDIPQPPTAERKHRARAAELERITKERPTEERRTAPRASTAYPQRLKPYAPQIRQYINRARAAGVLNDRNEWQRSKTELAIFCAEIWLNLTKETRTPWKDFETLFNTQNLRQTYGQYTYTAANTDRHAEIETIINTE